MIEAIRGIAPPEVYISNCTTISDISYMHRNPSWFRIKNEFGHLDVSRQPNGVYLFPTFHGRHNAGHWYLTILWKRCSLWFGWTADTLSDGKDVRASFSKNIIGKVINQRVVWGQFQCFDQSELECSPRTICHILAIVQHITT